MNLDSTEISSKANVVFPLTLKDAIEHLASQTSEYKPNDNNLHNKIWQRLSQRLRLIFDEFPHNRSKQKEMSTYDEESNDFKVILDCTRHQLSSTRKKALLRKLCYLYCAVTMYYIQHKGSPLSSSDVPEKWLQRKNSSELNLRDFISEVDKMCDTLHVKHSQDGTKREIMIVDALKLTGLVSLINNIEDLVTTTYNNITHKYMSYLEMRTSLSGIDEYLDGNRLITFLETYYDSNIEKIVTDHFGEYYDYCEAIKTLINIYTKVSNYIESKTSLTETVKTLALPAIWDEVSNTQTAVSQLELDFFSYLLKTIPPRSETNKNLSNQLSHGKWHLLSVEIRDKIIDYIIQMLKQPQRIARFLDIDFSDDDDTIGLIYSQTEDICMNIRYPHRNKAYNEVVSLYFILQGNKEILLSDELENIAKKVSKIRKELQNAVKDSVQNEQ